MLTQLFKAIFVTNYNIARKAFFIPAARNMPNSRIIKFFIRFVATSAVMVATVFGISSQFVYLTAGLAVAGFAAITDLFLTGVATVISLLCNLFNHQISLNNILHNIRGESPLRPRVIQAMTETITQTQATILAARPEMRLTEYILFNIFFAPSFVFYAPLRPRPPAYRGAPAVDNPPNQVEMPVEPRLEAPEFRANRLINQVNRLQQVDVENNIIVPLQYGEIIRASQHGIVECLEIRMMSREQLRDYFLRAYGTIFFMEIGLALNDFNALPDAEKYFYYASAATAIFKHSAEWLSAARSQSIAPTFHDLEENRFARLEFNNVITFQWIASFLNSPENDIISENNPEHNQRTILVLKEMRDSFINFLEKLKEFRENDPANEPLDAGLVVAAAHSRVIVKIKAYAAIYNQLNSNHNLRNIIHNGALFFKWNTAAAVVGSERPLRNIVTTCFAPQPYQTRFSATRTPIEYFAAIESLAAPKARHSTDIIYLRNSIKKRIEAFVVILALLKSPIAVFSILSGSSVESSKLFLDLLIGKAAFFHIKERYKQGYSYPDCFTEALPSCITDKLMPFTKDLRNPNICYEISLWQASVVLAFPLINSIANNKNNFSFLMSLATMYHITYFLSKFKLPALRHDIALDMGDVLELAPEQLQFGAYFTIIKKVLSETKTNLTRTQVIDGFSNTLLLLMAHFLVERYRSQSSDIAVMKIAFKMLFIWGPLLHLMSQVETYIAATRAARATIHSVEPLAQPETAAVLELPPAFPIVSFAARSAVMPRHGARAMARPN